MDYGQPLSFGALMRRHRLTAGLTQEQLAERAGISVRSISDLERGLYQVPHRDTVDRIVSALELTEEDATLLQATVTRQRGPPPPAQQGPRDRVSPATAPLPTGLVTFLALQIQDGRRLLERAPDQMAQAIEGYDRLSQSSVEENGGVLVPPRQATGDIRLAVFRTASDATAVAINIQRLAHEQPWPADATLRISMALHTGEAELRNGEYYGSAVGRCERLLGLAAGGHVILSQVTSELVRAGLPAGATLRDLGEHHVADMYRPEHVFELIWPGAPQDVPPISSLSTLHAHAETVLRGLIDGRVVIFAGETINLSGRPNGAAWQPGSTEYLPTSSEMAGFLATSFHYPGRAPQELVRVAQFVSTMVGSGPLYDRIHILLNAEYRPTPLHEFLAELPAALTSRREAPVYLLIVTSSYDDALERAFLQAGQPFDVVSYIAEGESRGRFSHKPPTADRG